MLQRRKQYAPERGWPMKQRVKIVKISLGRGKGVEDLEQALQRLTEELNESNGVVDSLSLLDIPKELTGGDGLVYGDEPTEMSYLVIYHENS